MPQMMPPTGGQMMQQSSLSSTPLHYEQRPATMSAGGPMGSAVAEIGPMPSGGPGGISSSAQTPAQQQQRALVPQQVHY
jgi:hypothetical protein